MSAIADSPTQATPESPTTPRLGLTTLVRYLFGSRDAILAVASSRQALWLGLLFVLSTGLAREYDGAYLAAEPWHVILPSIASLATSALLFQLIKMAAPSHQLTTLGWTTGYRTMLAFFWMTAPLAWIYAIPVERLFDAGTAMRLNLLFLAIVSLWRVLLITRALGVWLGESEMAMFWIVAFFGDSVALILSWLTPTPIWDIMGGVRLPPAESAVLDWKITLYLFGIPAWFVLTAAACYVMFGRQSRWSLQVAPTIVGPRVTLPAWTFGALLVFVGCALLPWGQPEQARAHEARRLFAAGQIDDAVSYIAKVSLADFPPHWRPPPNVGYGQREPRIADVLVAIAKLSAPDWLRDIYFEKLASSTYQVAELVKQAEDGDAAGLQAFLGYLERDVRLNNLRWPMRDELKRARESLKLDAELRARIGKYLREPRHPTNQGPVAD